MKKGELQKNILIGIELYRQKVAVSSEREVDIVKIQEFFQDSQASEIDQYLKIECYVKSMRTGWLGRSELRRCIMQALEKTDLRYLIQKIIQLKNEAVIKNDELLAIIRQTDSLDSPFELLLKAKEQKIQLLENELSSLKEEAEEVSDLNQELVEKHASLIQHYKSLQARYLKLHQLAGNAPEEDLNLLSFGSSKTQSHTSFFGGMT